MRKPDFITFTGLDARTDLQRAADLAQRYPVEWAVLFSPKRQGLEPRYPDGETQARILWNRVMASSRGVAAHLCGEHSRRVMLRQKLDVPVDLGHFRRVQVNHQHPDATDITCLQRGWGCTCIAQTRGAFPDDDRISWLFDRSGGTGTPPEFWPRHPGGGRLVGFAGGIGPDNVLEVLARIDSDGPYWIDMETGIRTDDWLDLDKCEAVCRAVYGDL